MKSVLGVVFCGALATAMSFLLRESSIGAALPLMFLLVVIPIAHVSGAITGVLASVTAGLAFALVLFRPFGSLHIENLADRLNLAFFAVASVAVACLSSSAFRTQPSVSRQDR